MLHLWGIYTHIWKLKNLKFNPTSCLLSYNSSVYNLKKSYKFIVYHPIFPSKKWQFTTGLLEKKNLGTVATFLPRRSMPGWCHRLEKDAEFQIHGHPLEPRVEGETVT